MTALVYSEHLALPPRSRALWRTLGEPWQVMRSQVVDDGLGVLRALGLAAQVAGEVLPLGDRRQHGRLRTAAGQLSGSSTTTACLTGTARG